MKTFHIFIFISAFVFGENISSVHGGNEGMVKMLKEQFEKLKDILPKTLKMDAIDVDAEGVVCHVKNLEATGVGNSVVEKIDFTDKPSVDIILVSKDFKESGEYKASGKFQGKEVKGSGAFSLKISDLKSQVYLEFSDKKISKFDFKILSKDLDKIELVLEGLELDGKKVDKDEIKKLIPIFQTVVEKDSMKQNISKELQKFLDDVILKIMG